MLRSLLIGLLGVALAVAFAVVPALVSPDERGQFALDTLIGAIPLLVSAFVPFFAVLKMLEPRQFSGVPATPWQVALSLLVTTVVSWPFAWLLAWFVALLTVRPALREIPGQTALALLLLAALAICFARVSSGLLRLLVPRQGIAAVRWIGLLLLVLVLPVLVVTLTEAFRAPLGEATTRMADGLGWTPFAAPIAGLDLAAQGDGQGAMLRFAVAGAALVVLLVVWFAVAARSLRSIERPADFGAARDSLDAFERFSAKPREVIAARALTYWRRDPRYRVALIAIPFAPIVMLIALRVAGVDLNLLALLPLPVILLLLGWAVHNDVALDSTAIWMHVASGTRGRDDRAGRLAPVFAIGLPLVVIGSSLSVIFVGDWHVLPAVLGMNFAVLLVSAAVSSVFSALMPYPATRPGDTPFAQPSVQGSGAGLAQTLTMLLSLLFAMPAVTASVIAIAHPTFLLNMLALAVGVVWGVLVLLLGLWLGGRVFDRRGPELVAITQTFD